MYCLLCRGIVCTVPSGVVWVVLMLRPATHFNLPPTQVSMCQVYVLQHLIKNNNKKFLVQKDRKEFTQETGRLIPRGHKPGHNPSPLLPLLVDDLFSQAVRRSR